MYEVKARPKYIIQATNTSSLENDEKDTIKFILNKQKRSFLINGSFFLVFAFYFINKSDYDVMLIL